MQSYLYNQKRRKTYGNSKIKLESLSGIILSIHSGAVFDTRKLRTTLHKPDASFHAPFLLILHYLSRLMTKPTICLCIQRRLSHDQPGHPPSVIRVFAVRIKKAWALSYPIERTAKTDQTGRMPKLIWVFAGRIVILLVLSWGGSVSFYVFYFLRIYSSKKNIN